MGIFQNISAFVFKFNSHSVATPRWPDLVEALKQPVEIGEVLPDGRVVDRDCVDAHGNFQGPASSNPGQFLSRQKIIQAALGGQKKNR